MMEGAVNVFLTALSSIIGYFVWRIQRAQVRQEHEAARRERERKAEIEAVRAWRDAITSSTIAMSRYMLLDIYRHAAQDGYATPEQLTAFEALYTSYHDLGGNGIVTVLRDRLLELPTQPDAPERG